MALATARPAGYSVGTDERSRCAHLLRRTGFGATSAEVDAAVARGYEATVELLLTGPDPGADAVPLPPLTPPPLELPPDLKSIEIASLIAWWVKRMAASTNPLREKLPFFWHGLFTSSLEKVRYPKLMFDQNLTIRQLGWGNFEQLAYALTVDPAMLLWLDNLNSKKGAPNENYAREFMELFALGRVGASGQANYSETDVKEAARALTGWTINATLNGVTFNSKRWDSGTKTLLGETGAWGTADVVRIVTHHPASHRWIPTKLWSFFAYPTTPADPVVAELAASYAADLDVTNLLRRILLHPEFQSAKARTGLVKTPVEWLVGGLRALQIPANELTGSPLVTLQQLPFAPPNVAGWPPNGYWVTTASALDRLSIAQAAALFGVTTPVDAAAPADRPAAAAQLLGIEAWSPRTHAALAAAAGEPKSLVALALVSPEYLLN